MAPEPVIKGLNCRQLTALDVPALATIEKSSHQHPWSEQQFRECINAGYLCHGFSMLDDEHLIGYWVAQTIVDELEILNICVAVNQQHKGHGKRMMNSLVVLARALKVRRLLLEVRESNKVALGLYRRIGFLESGRRKYYYPLKDGDREDAILMTLSLS